VKTHRTLLAATACALLGACQNAPLPNATLSAATQIDTNRQIAQRFLLAIPSRDAAAMRAVLSPETCLTLTVAGVYSSELHAFPQGTHWDRAALIQNLLAFQRALTGPFTLEILSLIAEGDLVAAEVIGHGIRAANQRPYIQHYSFHFTIGHGRILDIRLYQDTFHLWDVWENPGAPATPPYHGPDGATVSARQPSPTPAPPSTPAHTSEDELAANKDAVRRFLTAVPAHDPEASLTAWAPDGVWSFAVGGGYSPALRAFQGAPRWERDAMIRMQQNSQTHLTEPMTLDIYSLIAEGDQVSAEAVGFLVRPNGRAYRQHYSMHFTLRDGKLIEGHVYQDTLHQYDLALDHLPGAQLTAPHTTHHG